MLTAVLVVILSLNSGDLVKTYTLGFKDVKQCVEEGKTLPDPGDRMQMRWACVPTGVLEQEVRNETKQTK